MPYSDTVIGVQGKFDKSGHMKKVLEFTSINVLKVKAALRGFSTRMPTGISYPYP
jgi:hypothetical protein